ncbi:hypothetical protein DH2020_010326 [Rehmannia glutinosa]|uniref:Uncharacterized protein n=1 Tax=Rehmannia glutinosa TaxID=99300 RepID=A0ABR0XAB9_REHGL
MRLLGSNTEEQWMRSMNLAITNWISELQAANVPIKTPSPLFSYSFSTFGLWKVQLYCPVIAMNVEKSSGPNNNIRDDRLLFSLNYHQLEGVIQLNYRVIVQEKWIDVMVNTDNIRCDVVKLLTDTLMNERGAGTSEKHFPSRISLQITPTTQSNVISISVAKSSENHPTKIGVEKGIEASFDPPTAIGLHFSAGETITTSLKPWKFESGQVCGTPLTSIVLADDDAWTAERFSRRSRPSWRCSTRRRGSRTVIDANRPFTRQGGVIFAGDEYGEGVSWKVDRGCMGSGGVMEWEIKGWIWVTYWPNKHRTFYTETRKLEFREVVHLTLV